MRETINSHGGDIGDRSRYSLSPLLIDARSSHEEGIVRYDEIGTVTFCHPHLVDLVGQNEVQVPLSHQFPAVRATFDDLNKALSSLANSPLLADGRTLRQMYEEESAHYEELVAQAFSDGLWEPDYGTYVYDHFKGDLYLIAPEFWHRLALVTSNSMLLTDPEGKLSWMEVRQKLESAVVGFAGASVGGNVLEGWLRDARPKQAKIADPDWVEITNFNRGERMSIRHLAGSRAQRFDPRNPYEVIRVPKAEYLAYEAHMVDPYATLYVYSEGLTRNNIEQFFLGQPGGEPPVGVFVEEMDDLDLKVLTRQFCREHRIPVLMMSDFGHKAHAKWNHFDENPSAPLGYQASDEELLRVLDLAKAGERTALFEFVGKLCGEDYASDQFKIWIEDRGEQPTSSRPQSGATAMASGAIGGKEIALHILGYRHDGSNRAVYDLLHRRAVDK